MKTLSQVMQLVEPPGQVTTLKGIAPLLDVNPQYVSLRRVLQNGSCCRTIVLSPLTVSWQNLALLPENIDVDFEVWGIHAYTYSKHLYKGTDRNKVLACLKDYLRNGPDIAGICEFWVRDERGALVAELADYYPFNLQGPINTDPNYPMPTVSVPIVGGNVPIHPVFDGGLLLLSRHPIIESHQHIYIACMGEDCLAFKGILHARIEISAQGQQIDVFLTHMQSCPTEIDVPTRGPGCGCWEKLTTSQLDSVWRFIHDHSSPDRPALLMGDLNQNALDPARYHSLIQTLPGATDLWLITGDGTTGITTDAASSFDAASEPRSPYDSSRHINGSRIDYLFSWGWTNDTKVSPLYFDTRLLALQSEYGRDLSDHYGLLTNLKCVRELEPCYEEHIPAQPTPGSG